MKIIISLVVVVLIAVGSFAVNFARDIGAIAGGYAANTLCTNVIMIGRDQVEVERLDLSADQRRLTTSVITGNNVETTASLGPVNVVTTAVYRPGLGCTVLNGFPIEQVLASGLAGDDKVQYAEAPFVKQDHPPVNQQLDQVDYDKLALAVDNAFAETTDDLSQAKNTRAVLVHYQGELIAERYGQGFDSSTPQRGMSMTKSVVATLVGILVGQGRLDINQVAPLSYWENRAVTTDQLLKMTVGFDYDEAYETDPRNLLNTMLMATADMPAFAAQTPLRAKPGETWDYQTTHSVLLQKVIRTVINNDQTYYRFAKKELFNKLDMPNSFFQTDASGTQIGGAFMYASARDWLRLGELYLNDGVYKGEQILPTGWVEYSVTPSAPSMEKRAYGAQIWLNAPSPEQLFPGLPEDAYAFQGHYGQYVIVVPSRDLVVVRLGMSFNKEAFDKQQLLREVIAAIEP